MNAAPQLSYPSHQEYNGIQALRFLAAMMVVVMHSTFYAEERLPAPGFFWPEGDGGVDLFFVISGFVMYVSGARLAENPGGWRIFAQRRLIRIVPLYWLVTTVKLVIMLSTARLVLHAKFDPIELLCSYLFLPHYNVEGAIEPLLGVGWTLNFEMFFYAIFAVGIALRRNLVFNVVGVLALLALGSLFRPSPEPAAAFYLNPIVLEFAFGIIVAALINRGKSAPPGLALVLFVVSLAVTLTPFVRGLTGWIGHGVPAAFLVYAAASLEGRFGQRIPRFILFFGAASYSLYLSHPLIAPMVPTILSKMGILWPLASAVGSVVVAVPVACGVFVLVERPLSAAVKRFASARGSSRRPSVSASGIS